MIHKIARRTFEKVLAMMATDWKKNSDADFSTRMTISKAVLSHNFANFVLGVFSIAITLYCASIFTFNTSNLEETDISMRPLILKMNFPFDIDTRFIYGLISLAQFCFMVFCGSAVVTLNALLIILVSEMEFF